ncbi:acylneuraminate cytidylyltransferase family protein [Firmicutes bacterium AF22-6AC]|jgi:CMP-N,N'-diacetyllegionaminic acid synthase|nr:acylneuraminate cytidylyltransferase family protein [Firmicutes bacterium AF22-6AC]
MIEKNKIVALIPARGGSKGIKNKNIIDLCGKPLISYTIQAALESKYIDKVIVSTDSQEIADVAIKYGAEVPFLRPGELASDTSKTIDAVMHAVGELEKRKEEYDILILLQATQPLRTADDIDSAIELFIKNKGQSLVSVSPVEDNPILIRTIDNLGRMNSILPMKSTCRRQDMPLYYRVNGCIYINLISELDLNTSFNDNKIPYIMPKERSVDIDEIKDLLIAQYYISRNE